MHLIQCKEPSAPFEEPILRRSRKKHKKVPFFLETPILGSFLTILINFFSQKQEQNKSWVFFAVLLINQEAIKHDIRDNFSVFFSYFMSRGL